MSDLFIQHELKRRELLYGRKGNPVIAVRSNNATEDPDDAPPEEQGEHKTRDRDHDGAEDPKDGAEDPKDEADHDEADHDEADDPKDGADPDDGYEDFEYLDEDQLQYEFGMCNETRDITKTYTVRLCAYDLRSQEVDEVEIPFVLHLMQFDGQLFNYPQFSFRCFQGEQREENVDDEEDQDNTTHFKNECLMHLSDMIQDIEGVTYRGFLLDKSPSNPQVIYVFYNVTDKIFIQSESLPRVWASIDEIMNQHRVNGFPVQRHPVFLQHPHAIFVKKNGVRAYVPEILYLCDVDESGRYNNLFEENHETEEEMKSVQFLDNRIPHAILGNFYILSKVPISPTTPGKPIRRFLGFCERGIYLTEPLPHPKTLANMSLGDVIPTLVDYFSKKTPKTDINSDATEVDASGSPVDVSGSPVDVSGSPVDVSGSPLDVSGSTTSSTTSSGFLSSLFGSKDVSGSPVDVSGSTTSTGFLSSLFGSKDVSGSPVASESDASSKESEIPQDRFPGNSTAQDRLSGDPHDFAQDRLSGDPPDFAENYDAEQTLNSPSDSLPSTTWSLESETQKRDDRKEGDLEQNRVDRKEGDLEQNEDVPDTPNLDPQRDATMLQTFLSSNQHISCIYFQEIANETRIPFWCIKSDKYYLEI